MLHMWELRGGDTCIQPRTDLLLWCQGGGPVYNAAATLPACVLLCCCRVSELARRKLVCQGTRVLVTAVRKEHRAREVEVCARSELLVDPDAAAAAGLQYGRRQRKEWARVWQWKEQQLRAAAGVSKAPSSSDVGSEGWLLGAAPPTQPAAGASQPQQAQPQAGPMLLLPQQQPAGSVVDSQATIKYPVPARVPQ